MPTVARTIVDALHLSGVRRVYGVSGDSLNGLTDAIRARGDIAWVPVRHEETAAFAASAESQLTGDLAVCVGSCGPGNLHLINGLFDAQRSRTPVLAIAAHIPSAEIGSQYFQETHPQELFRECSVFVEHVSSPEQMPRLLRTALRAALERRGVAVLVVPGDIGLAEIDAEPEAVRTAPSTVVPDRGLLQEAADALNGSSRVAILAGAGAAGAHDELLALADTLQAPVVHALRGKDVVEPDNPFDVGLTGLLGFSSGYHALTRAETLLILGSSLPYRQFYPQDATVIQVDVRGESIGLHTRVDVPLVGGVKETAHALLPLLKAQRSSRFLDSIRRDYARTRKDLDDLATPSKRTIHPQYVARLLDELADDDAVFIPDVGSPVVWAARYLTMNGRRRLIGSFSHGSMANAITQAVGAQAADPSRQVVAMAGDGGLTMMLGELLTQVQNGLPVKTVVFSNSSLNFVELEMKAAGFETFATDLLSPDFSAVADALGVKGFRATTSKELPAVMAQFLAHDGPALLDVVVERHELTLPPAIELEQAKGFSLYALKTVMSGRGSELVDLAKANLRQLL
ncbi:ubiquinone-dependent pyruvate dehydrogenase [Micrococcus sp.]|uniref:ubiquinone-dependent pyruvate dehydrogenase n=1 Tax=Micrococcus sp. TaxID=1271 RepID=UPI0026DC7D80|nr:ubiquinone-dependent pyruvate dehydrogenase [Micrococcus sp.]MDO4239784.1 ubiquinone-dependent pyruvate dehydrogenase [Micrococcus sp.]